MNKLTRSAKEWFQDYNWGLEGHAWQQDFLLFVAEVQRETLEDAAKECDDTNPAVFAAGERIRKLKPGGN